MDITIIPKYKTEKKQILTQNVKFGNLFTDSIKNSNGDTFTMSDNTKINNKAYKWLNSELKKEGKASVEKAYNACLNADNCISDKAFNLLKDEITKQNPSFFNFKKDISKPYQKFGIDFLSYMIDASKDNRQNHKDSNLEFCKKVLDVYESKNPTDYLNIITKSKDKQGNIDSNLPRIFNLFNAHNDIPKYFNFINYINTLNPNEKSFILKYYAGEHRNSTLLEILKGIQGRDSEKLILSVTDDLDKYGAKKVSLCLNDSVDVNKEANLSNYKKLINEYKDNEWLHQFCPQLKDKDGIVRDENISFVNDVMKITNENASIVPFLNITKDKNGVVDKDFASHLIRNLKVNKKANDYQNIIESINVLRNNDGELKENAWDSVNAFHAFRRFTNNSYSALKHHTFERIVSVSKDKNGNIIPEIVMEIPSMMNEGLLNEIPHIIKASVVRDSFDKDLYKANKEFILLQKKDERYDLSKYLSNCFDKDGNFDKNIYGAINKLQGLHTDSNIFEISDTAKNPDGKVSMEGIDLFVSLKKTSRNSSKNLIKMVDLSKDKNGFVNSENAAFIEFLGKKINSFDAVEAYTNEIKNRNGVVEKDCADNLKEVLQKSKNPDDYKKIIHCIHHSKNKAGLIQWNYVNFTYNLEKFTDNSEEAKKHHTYERMIDRVTDKDGNFIPEMTDVAKSMMKEGLLNETPIILKLSQKDGKLDKDLCDLSRRFISNVSSSERYKTAKKLMTLDKIDTNALEALCKIQKSDKKADAFELFKAIKTSDNKISDKGLNLLEYIKKDLGIKKDEDAIKLLNLAHDKTGGFNDNNISFIKELGKYSLNVKSIETYTKYAKKGTGEVNKEIAEKLPEILQKIPNPNDYENTLICVHNSKNNNGKIQWKYISTLYNLKVNSDKSKMGKKFGTFKNTLKAIKDKDGNIVPEFAQAANVCLHNRFLYEIPTILTLSKNNDTLDKNIYKRITDILEKTDEKDRYKMSEYINSLTDKNNNLNDTKLKFIEKIQDLGIKQNIVGLVYSLKNPDGSISVTGLNLVTGLRKKYHHQIEPDLAKIVKICRDKSGYLNNKNVDAAKELLKLNKDIDVPQIMSALLNSKHEIDDSKYQPIIKLISEYHISDTSTINKIIGMSKGKNGSIDPDMLKFFVKIVKKGKNIDNYKDIFPVYKALYKYEHVVSFSQLNLRQKRDYMKALTKYQNDIQNPKFREMLDSKIFPNNGDEYCITMGRLSHSVGISASRLPKNVEANYYKAMRNLENPRGEFLKTDFDKDTPVLKLDYPLKDFKKDIWNLTKNYSYSERTKALDYYGFELKQNGNQLELSGFPNADKPDGRLAAIKDKNVLHLINKLSPYVIKFVSQNSVTVKNKPQMSKDLTDIVRAFPEFLTTVGKEQHRTHDFTLDVHSLKVLQDVMKNPAYQSLSNTDKKEMQLIALFHDLSKTEKQVDREHPENSAFNMYYLLNKLGLKEKNKLEIYNVINNHDWLTHFDFSNYSARDIAFKMRGGESLKMLMMLSRADLKGVKKHDTYYKMYGSKLQNAQKKVEPYLEDLQETAINLPQTKIPKASKLNLKSSHVKRIHADGIKNTVVYLKDNMNLKSVGFDSCKNTNDFNVIVHGLDNRNAAYMFQALGMIDSDALLSTSYIVYSKGNYKAFRKEGFILDVPSTNIHAAYWRDFGSGYKKTIKGDLYRNYLFCNNPTRNYISDELKGLLNIGNRSYAKLIKKIEDMPIEELEVKYPKIARAYKTLFSNMEISKRNYGRNYNEILVSSPKIQGIFCYNERPEEISTYLRRYAERNNIPIIVFE